MAVMKDTDDGWMSAGKRSNDSAVGATVAADIRDIHDDLISMHGRPDGVRRNKNVARQASLQTGIE
jgi:hypothetical protein